MSLILWSRPYAAYGQKASVALYELGLPFEPKLVGGANEAVMAGFRALSPFAKMPTLVDAATGQTLYEPSIVIEHLDRLAGGGRLIPADPGAALEARLIGFRRKEQHEGYGRKALVGAGVFLGALAFGFAAGGIAEIWGDGWGQSNRRLS